MIAALYVDPRGAYAGLADVEVWDEARDARAYAGPHRVVAHPPCARWCRLAGLTEKTYGIPRHKDGGCFQAALDSVRRWGGVLEHPAWSDAWWFHGLNKPPRAGGWVAADFVGGWTCYIEQGHYGHRARKGTFLYAVGVDLPSLRWGELPQGSMALVSGGDNDGAYKGRPRVWQSEAIKTPEAFRDVLLDMVRD